MNFMRFYDGGPILIEVEKHGDSRGDFARIYCEDAFMAEGIPTNWPQQNLSKNHKIGTIRGMHFQAAPYEEPKVVRCLQGKMFDVAINLRRSDPNFLRVTTVELNDAEANALYVPAGFAHGFQTMSDNVSVLYLMGEKYVPSAQMGIRWNDPLFNIPWPIEVNNISERDDNYPDFSVISLDKTN